MRILKATVFSVLLYGSESWLIDSGLEAKINVFGMNCYRAILGISRLDHTRNEDVLVIVNQMPLAIEAKQRQLEWLGRVLKRADDDPAKIFALYEPRHGQRGAGRPRTSFRQYIATQITSDAKDMTAKNIVELAKREKEWEKRVAACRYRTN